MYSFDLFLSQTKNVEYILVNKIFFLTSIDNVILDFTPNIIVLVEHKKPLQIT